MQTGEEHEGTPDLSIVLTVVDGDETLAQCLDALAEQEGTPNMEVLVPYDHITSEVGDFAARYPQFTFLDLGTVLDGLIPDDPLQTHFFYDIRRAAALREAKGRLVGIIEDRGVPAPDWAAQMIGLHDAHPHAAIGGAVTNGVDHLKNWAVFFCDFSRYQPPLAVENPEYVTDTNVVYKRAPLMEVRDLWDVQYLEPQVNWALQRNGHRMMLTDQAVTRQHRVIGSLSSMLGERYHWARKFGQIRGREISTAKRLSLSLTIPALPFLLLFRHLRRQQAKGHHLKEFVMAAPLTFLLLVFWSLGELVGYAQAKPPPK